jgi:transposase
LLAAVAVAESAREQASTRRRGPKPLSIALTEQGRTSFEAIVRRATAPQRDVLRARIVLLADQGLPNERIAQDLNCCENTVRKWRWRFATTGPKGLRDLPRSGRPRTFTAVQVAQVLAIATQLPSDHGVPFSHWNAAALQAVAVEAGITQSIHPTTIWRWLHDADIRPHRVRYWLKSCDPDFGARMRDVVGLYLAAFEAAGYGDAIFSVDEKTSIQALERKQPDMLPIPGFPHRIEYEYVRHGTLCLTAAFNVVTGEVRGALTPNRPAPVFASFIDTLCREEGADARQIHLVMDQLNTHWHHDLCAVVAAHSGISYDPNEHERGPERRAFLMRTDKRVVVHYTPKHASWLNQIEIWFSVLGRKLLGRASFASLEALERGILEFIDYYNRCLAHPYRWTFTGAACRS